MRLVLSTGFAELGNYWGDWFAGKQVGGSEWIVLNLAREFVSLGHQVSLRLPYNAEPFIWQGVRMFGRQAGVIHGDASFCFDQYGEFDDTPNRILVACRSDAPRHTDFTRMVFLSRTHARLMGHPDSPSIGGGVNLADYERSLQRTPGLVICTSSPDRCVAAFDIGAQFRNFVFTYKPVGGLPLTKQLDRKALVELQRRARVHIYPLAPRRPSDFFSMSVLESLAAGTPVIVSDADSMVELWGSCTTVLKRPIRIAEWVGAVEELLMNKVLWNRLSLAGKRAAEFYDWPLVAKRYLAALS